MGLELGGSRGEVLALDVVEATGCNRRVCSRSSGLGACSDGGGGGGFLVGFEGTGFLETVLELF